MMPTSPRCGRAIDPGRLTYSPRAGGPNPGRVAALSRWWTMRIGPILLASVLLLAGCTTQPGSQMPSAPPATQTVATATHPEGAAVPATAGPSSLVRDAHLYPNPALTPGETLTVTTAQVSVPGYASSVRNVTTAEKRQVYAAYGIAYPQRSGTYECDHFIPLCLGGSNSISNLWPEPSPEFHWKDGFEVYLWRQVRAGSISLDEAQREVQTDWYAYWVASGRPGLATGSEAPAATAATPQADIGLPLSVVWSVSGKRYHYASCSYSLAIKPGNRRTGSVAAARKAGKTPCLVCNPPTASSGHLN